MPPSKVLPGTVTLVTEDPAPVGSKAGFTVESENPDLFIHLTARKDGELVYEAFKRWFLGSTTPVEFTLAPLEPENVPAEAVAHLEDWSTYYRNRRTTEIDSTSFDIV